MLETLSLTEQNAVSAQISIQTFLGKVIFIQMQKEGHRYNISSVSEETFHLICHEAFYSDVDVFFTMIISDSILGHLHKACEAKGSPEKSPNKKTPTNEQQNPKP